MRQACELGPGWRFVRWCWCRGDIPLALRGVQCLAGWQVGEFRWLGALVRMLVILKGARGRLRPASPNPSVARHGWLKVGGWGRRQEAVQRQRGGRGRSLLGRGVSDRRAGLWCSPVHVYVAPLCWSGDLSPCFAGAALARRSCRELECADWRRAS